MCSETMLACTAPKSMKELRYTRFVIPAYGHTRKRGRECAKQSVVQFTSHWMHRYLGLATVGPLRQLHPGWRHRAHPTYE